MAGLAAAEGLRLATYNPDLSAPGPGLVLDSLARNPGPQHRAVVEVLVALDADIVLLTGIDYDAQGLALGALADRLAEAGLDYPYRLALRPNTGIPTGRDIDRNGVLAEPRDAQGYGHFPGEGGMAVLSRVPVEISRDLSGFLWADLPGNLMPADDPARDIQRLATTGLWEITAQPSGGGVLHLLCWYASPPVFDGPEDRNGRRNHDEAAFWLALLDGRLPLPPPPSPFVILGQTSLDPIDGEGRPEALRVLMAHPALQDPAPRGTHGIADPGHKGDPGLDTAAYHGLGALRVDQILPSADLRVTAAGVLWPPDSDPLAATLAAASRHRPVWVEIAAP